MAVPPVAQLPAGHFIATFGPYTARIDEVLQHYPAPVLAAAAATIRDDDHDLPLRPEESTSDPARPPGRQRRRGRTPLAVHRIGCVHGRRLIVPGGRTVLLDLDV